MMKRNDLLAKSVTLGLAVATAAASMSTDGLARPQVVKAETAQERAESDDSKKSEFDGTLPTASDFQNGMLTFNISSITSLEDLEYTLDSGTTWVKGNETGSILIINPLPEGKAFAKLALGTDTAYAQSTYCSD